jgi:hypothetical protein
MNPNGSLLGSFRVDDFLTMRIEASVRISIQLGAPLVTKQRQEVLGIEEMI